ncbi:hypothetical protein [Micromonospora sp. DT233]|uniref:hypothetical protein n=1 Tax=Micromonospora sp. DT233 TaxID=3393432 RepID=UPI003CF77E8F
MRSTERIPLAPERSAADVPAESLGAAADRPGPAPGWPGAAASGRSPGDDAPGDWGLFWLSMAVPPRAGPTLGGSGATL